MKFYIKPSQSMSRTFLIKENAHTSANFNKKYQSKPESVSNASPLLLRRNDSENISDLESISSPQVDFVHLTESDYQISPFNNDDSSKALNEIKEFPSNMNKEKKRGFFYLVKLS